MGHVLGGKGAQRAEEVSVTPRHTHGLPPTPHLSVGLGRRGASARGSGEKIFLSPPLAATEEAGRDRGTASVIRRSAARAEGEATESRAVDGAGEAALPGLDGVKLGRPPF